MNLRRAFVLCSLVMVAVLMAACGGGDGQPTPAPTLRGAIVPTRATRTPTFTPTDTPTPTNTPTYTATFTNTPTPTDTPTSTFTPTLTPAPTDTPTETFTPSPTLTPSPTFTSSPTLAPSLTFTPSPTRAPSATPTPRPITPGENLNSGDVVHNTINDNNYAFSYTFAARRGDVVTIIMTRTSGSLDSLLYLQNAAGEELIRNDDYNPGILLDAGIEDFTIPEDGTYTIVATRFREAGGPSSGAFDLSFNLATAAPPPITHLNYGDVVPGTISDQDYAVEYMFDARRGDVVTILMSRVGGSLDSLLLLTNQAGAELIRNDDYNPGVSLDASIQEFTIPADGTYTIIATRFGQENGPSTGTFTLSLESASAGPPPIVGNRIEYGEVVSGEITDEAFAAEYVFTARRGDVVTILMNRVGGTLDSLLHLTNADGEILIENDDLDAGISLDAGIVDFVIPEDGAYTIVATRFGAENGGSTGTFRLTLEGIPGGAPPPTPAGPPRVEGTRIGYNEVAFGEITPDTFAIEYVFEARANDIVTIVMNRVDGSLDPLLYLQNGVGVEIRRNDDLDAGISLDAGIVNFTIPADGMYIIIATRFGEEHGNTTGSFNLTLELVTGEAPPPPPPEGNQIRIGTVVTGDINNEVSAREYVFPARRGDVITIHMDRLEGSLDPLLRLLNDRGEELAFNDDFELGISLNAGIVDFTIPADGMYIIIATRFGEQNGSTTGVFTLSLEGAPGGAPPPGEGELLPYGVVIPGEINDDAPVVRHMFSGRAGDVVTIIMERTGGSLDPLLYLLNDRGEELIRNDDYNLGVSLDAGIVEFVLPVDGIYTIVATRFQEETGNTTGTFNLSLDAGGAPGDP